MDYRNQEHQERYLLLLAEDQTRLGDIERESLFYIIAGNDDLYQKRNYLYDSRDHHIKQVFRCREGSVDLSGGAKALVRLGFNLYNGMNKGACVSEIFDPLDEGNRILAWNAIKLRYM